MIATQTRKTSATPHPGSAATRAMLACGVIAGPLFVVVGLAQALTRPGFDLTRHEVSLLSNGSLGWIQVTNFVVSGLLVMACAAGLRRVLQGGRGATWAPVLLGVYGLGLVGAGIFVADPMNGFPPGTPAGMPTTISLHGILHIVTAALGFIALVAGCFAMARRFASEGSRGWAVYSVVTGVVFLVAFMAVASGSRLVAINIAFGLAVVAAWTWISVVAARFGKAARS